MNCKPAVHPKNDGCGIHVLMKLFGSFESMDSKSGEMWGHYFELGEERYTFKFCPFCGKKIEEFYSIKSDRGL